MWPVHYYGAAAGRNRSAISGGEYRLKESSGGVRRHLNAIEKIILSEMWLMWRREMT